MNIKVKIAGSMVAVSLCSILTFTNFCVGGYEVVAEGRVIGFVKSPNEVTKITEKLDDEVYQNYGIKLELQEKIEFVEKTDLKENLSEEIELKKNISGLSELFCEAYVLTISQNEEIAFSSYDDLLSVLSKIKSLYTIDGATSEILEPLHYRKDYVSKIKILDTNQAEEYIKSNNLLSIKSSYITEYTNAISYDVKRIEDDSMYKGSVEIVVEGVVGESRVQAEVEYINLEEVSRQVLSEEVFIEPVTQIEKIGTLEPPSGFGTGEFIYPLEGRISSEYGQRWGRLHGGLDIAVPVGTKIVASDYGTVSFAGYCGSYGLLVKVDHGNGYITYYAHCNAINVNVGDCVVKGEVIALSGNTGNSTGPHCHFEIRYDNVPQNPLDYLK